MPTCDTRGYPNKKRAKRRQVGRCPVVRIRKPKKKTAVSSCNDFFRPIMSLINPANIADTRWPNTQILAETKIFEHWLDILNAIGLIWGFNDLENLPIQLPSSWVMWKSLKTAKGAIVMLFWEVQFSPLWQWLSWRC